MAQVFNKAVALVERIPDIENTQLLFRSLIGRLHEQDQVQVLEDLMDYVTRKEADNE